MPTKQYADNATRQRAYRRRKNIQKWTVSQAGIALGNVQIPVLRYFGAKWRLSPWIIEHFPAHQTYVEPFAGSASVLLRKGISPQEVISDLNPELMNFWAVVRNNPRDLIESLKAFDWTPESYRRACEADARHDAAGAAAFYVRNWLSWGSGTGKWKTGYRNPSSGAQRNFSDPLKFLKASQRLHTVTLLQQSAFDVIQTHDAPDTLFYVDPPYLHDVRVSSTDYSHELTRSEHGDLLDLLRSLQGKVVLSGYPSAFYRNALTWRYIEKSVSTRGTSRTEVLWLSPNVDLLSRLPLFANASSRHESLGQSES